MRAPLPTWAEVDAEATRLRREIGERLRQWAAMLHARGRHRGLPSRWMAAFDSTRRPYRSRLAQIDLTSTDRDHAEAAADDLWDAVAQSWCLVQWANAERLEHAPPGGAPNRRAPRRWSVARELSGHPRRSRHGNRGAVLRPGGGSLMSNATSTAIGSWAPETLSCCHDRQATENPRGRGLLLRFNAGDSTSRDRRNQGSPSRGR